MAATDEVVKVSTEQEVASPVAAPAAEKAKTKKVSVRKARSPPAHPPYIEMINEALTTLKEKNGSSQYAIQKFIEENHKNLPSNFRKLLLVSLRRFVASGRLVKVKASFKIPSKASATAPKAKPATTAAAAKSKKKVVAAAAKPKKAAAKPKAKTAAVAAKPKAKATAVTAKPKAKAAKTVAAPAKVTGTKRKAVAAVKPKAKVAKTAAKSTPSKKAAPAAKPAAKKTVVKKVKAAVKPKSVKTAPKRALSTRGKK